MCTLCRVCKPTKKQNPGPRHNSQHHPAPRQRHYPARPPRKHACGRVSRGNAASEYQAYPTWYTLFTFTYACCPFRMRPPPMDPWASAARPWRRLVKLRASRSRRAKGSNGPQRPVPPNTRLRETDRLNHSSLRRRSNQNSILRGTSRSSKQAYRRHTVVQF